MIEHVWDTAGDEMKGIDETLDFLSSESISKLENAITTFFKMMTFVFEDPCTCTDSIGFNKYLIVVLE